MTWTYDDELPTNRDKVRLMVGDTVSTSEQVSDEAIDLALTNNNGRLYYSASDVAMMIAAKYARDIPKSIGSTSLSLGERWQHYIDLAKELRRQAAMNVPVAAYLGGVSLQERREADRDTDLPKLPVTQGFMDHPGYEPVSGGEWVT